jgi:hypothetical protein
MVLCMPEGKNRALTVIQRSKQAFVSLGPLIQLGSSQLPTNARENRIWPVRRPLEAAAAASRVRGSMGGKKSYPLLPNAIAEQIAAPCRMSPCPRPSMKRRPWVSDY